MPLKALIFDLGDVLFTWSASTTTCIPAKTLHSILKSKTWAEFDCGRITQDECYKEVAQQYPFSSEEIHEAFTQARKSLQPNREIIAVIKNLKNMCNGALKIFAMSNISKEDYAYVAPRVADWDVFDRVFTSGHAGMRKPDPKFYQYVLQQVRASPEEVMFFDDKEENVRAAQKLGIKAFVFKENRPVVDVLHGVENDPREKGYRYLQENKDNLQSITDSDVTISDNFARLLIQDTIPCCKLFRPDWKHKRTWNFFDGEVKLVPGKKFPDDLDTTSLALMVLPPNREVAESMLDEMLEYVHEDGRFQTYFDWSKPRVDEIVSANVLACFYHFGRGNELPQTLDLVHDVLLERKYESGTRYYPHADCCLYFIGRLLQSSDDPRLHDKLEALLKDRVQERVGQDGSSIELAMRIITCNSLGIDCYSDVSKLLARQTDDCGWPVSYMYRYGSTGVQLGNRGVVTAMAIKALDSL